MARKSTVTKSASDNRIVKRTLRHGQVRYDTYVNTSDGQRTYQTFKRKQDAEDWRDQSKVDVRNHVYRELIPGTFREYVTRWRDKYLVPAELKYSTLGVYGYLIDAHLLMPSRGKDGPTEEERQRLPARHFDKEIAAITTADVTDFRSELLPKKSAASIRKIMALLGRIFADACEDGYLRVDPMPTRKRKIDKGKGARRGRALDPATAQLLLAECEDDDDLRLVILIALLSGLRRGEIFALDWPSINWEKDVLHVKRNLHWAFGRFYEKADDQGVKAVIDTPKSATSVRDVDLNPELKKALRTRFLKAKDKRGLIFKSREGTPLDPANVVSRKFFPAVERAIEKAKEANNEAAVKALDGLHFHDLRHTFGSWLVAQGEDILYVSAQMGHARPSITADVYSHLLKARRPEAARKMANLLFGSKLTSVSE